MNNKYLLPFVLGLFASVFVFCIVGYNLGYVGFFVDYLGEKGIELSRVLTAIFGTFTIALACSRDDFQEISDNRVIVHWQQWLFRAVMVCLLLFVCKISIVYSVACAGLFSFVFNFDLNRRRELPINYMSDSNWYDSFFMWAFRKYSGAAQNVFEFLLMSLFFKQYYI